MALHYAQVPKEPVLVQSSAKGRKCACRSCDSCKVSGMI